MATGDAATGRGGTPGAGLRWSRWSSLPGNSRSRDARADVVVWIARIAPATRITAASVCTGASLLAAAGLLEFGATANTGVMPCPIVVGPDQLTPSLLVQTFTREVPSPFAMLPAMAHAPAAFTERLEEPHAAGAWTGVDQAAAACAGVTTATPIPSAVTAVDSEGPDSPQIEK